MMRRVILVERKEGYPSAIPYNSPLLELLHFFSLVAKGKIKDLHTTDLYEQFKKLKTPSMSTQMVFMGMHMLVTCNAEMVRHILTEREKYVKMTHVSADGDRLIAQGVFSSEGKQWQHQREVLNPSFKYAKLRSLVPLFCETTSNLIDQIEKQGFANERKSFDVRDWITRTTLDAIGKAGFGFNFNAVDHTNEGMLNNYNTLIKGITNLARVFAAYRMLPLKANREMEGAMATFEDTINTIIAEKKRVVQDPFSRNRLLIS